MTEHSGEGPMSSVGAGLVQKMSRAQELGQSLAGLKASVVEMDQRRAKLRETGHALRRSEQAGNKNKSYTAVCEDLMVQYPNEFLQKTFVEDVKTLDKVIEETRAEIKTKLDEFLRLEGDKELSELGFNLKSLAEKDFDG